VSGEAAWRRWARSTRRWIPNTRRWLGSTSNRTFIVWPLLLTAAEALLQGGWPRLHLAAAPLLVWGYLQYRLVGEFRMREGGGGPGLSNPPERLVRHGPYRYLRNPMYLGHLIFFAGLALTLGSWIGAAVFAFHAVWFDRRARGDERHLAQRFGEPYRDYCAQVKRWLPGAF
jgi:protein-S-isoprenylcysteine O-methyltransferase Ste14